MVRSVSLLHCGTQSVHTRPMPNFPCTQGKGIGKLSAMRAMALNAPGPIETSPLALFELSEPEPAADEIRVRVEACGICRTDLHVVEGELPPHRQRIVPGHQVVGR